MGEFLHHIISTIVDNGFYDVLKSLVKAAFWVIVGALPFKKNLFGRVHTFLKNHFFNALFLKKTF